MRATSREKESGDESPHSRGFTLVEMLVAIMIILILSAMTVALVNVSMDSDRLRSSARQVQSYLAGARDRAIFSGQPRGVRFLLNPDMTVPIDTNGDGNPDDVDGDGQPDFRTYTVDSLVFVGDPGLARGTLRLAVGDDPRTQQPNGAPLDDTTRGLIQVVGTPWSDLYTRGLLVPGSRIRIINGSTKVWLNIDRASFPPRQNQTGPFPIYFDQLLLVRPHPDYLRGTVNGHPQPNAPDAPAQRDLEYELELAPAVLPNQDPVLLARGIAIDLEAVLQHPRGKFPGIWFGTESPHRYSRHIDVMFSPRGTVLGPLAAFGLVHFLLADVGDIERRTGLTLGQGARSTDVDGFIDRDVNGNGQLDEDEQSVGGRLLVTVFTRTGQISTTPVDPLDQLNNLPPNNPGADGFADDPFYFAEHGEVAK